MLGGNRLRIWAQLIVRPCVCARRTVSGGIRRLHAPWKGSAVISGVSRISQSRSYLFICLPREGLVIRLCVPSQERPLTWVRSFERSQLRIGGISQGKRTLLPPETGPDPHTACQGNAAPPPTTTTPYQTGEGAHSLHCPCWCSFIRFAVFLIEGSAKINDRSWLGGSAAEIFQHAVSSPENFYDGYM